MLSDMAGQVGGKCERLAVNNDLTVAVYGNLCGVVDGKLQGGLLVLGEELA